MFYRLIYFTVLQSYIHLIPLWSAMLQLRTASLVTSLDKESAAKCHSNAIIESHFKAVKHGMLKGRKRLRPREFLCKSLAYITGKLNEKMLPQAALASRKRKVLQDSPEVWSKRRTKTKRYHDPAVAKKLFGNKKTEKHEPEKPETSRRTRKSATTSNAGKSAKKNVSVTVFMLMTAHENSLFPEKRKYNENSLWNCYFNAYFSLL
jgi:hypothetical protein